MQRILIVNVNWRGDVIFSTPFIRALRKRFPDSFIATLVVPRCAPILEHNPHLSEIIILDEQKKHRGLRGKLALIRLLRERKFDTAFLLHRSNTRTLVCWLAGIPERIGYYTRKRGWWLTRPIRQPKEQLHKVDYFLNIAKSLGIDTADKDYEVYFGPKDREYAQRLLAERGVKPGDFLVIINPGGNWQLKRWPKEKFARLVVGLIDKYQAKIIITGAASDRSLAEDIAAQIDGEAIVLAGLTTIGQLTALMSKANLVIANDSGPMHLAVSQGVGVVALFGPTSPKITGPYGRGNYAVIQKELGCPRPCYQSHCVAHQCMREIAVEEVLQAVERVIQSGPAQG